MAGIWWTKTGPVEIKLTNRVQLYLWANGNQIVCLRETWTDKIVCFAFFDTAFICAELVYSS